MPKDIWKQFSAEHKLNIFPEFLCWSIIYPLQMLRSKLKKKFCISAWQELLGDQQEQNTFES